MSTHRPDDMRLTTRNGRDEIEFRIADHLIVMDVPGHESVSHIRLDRSDATRMKFFLDELLKTDELRGDHSDCCPTSPLELQIPHDDDDLNDTSIAWCLNVDGRWVRFLFCPACGKRTAG